MAIHFGTDGWRGVIAEDFTFDNVRVVAQAVAGLIRDERGPKAPGPVGYDVRFLSWRFAEAVAAGPGGGGGLRRLPRRAGTDPRGPSPGGAPPAAPRRFLPARPHPPP